MLLFLDVISPIPEFSIIEENKVILQRKIISDESNKLSDNIFQIYMEINIKLDLAKNLQKIVITNGPGSYTSLRVGAAFVSGLKMAQTLLTYSFSVIDIIKFKSDTNNKKNISVFISSSNDQKFLCMYKKDGKIEYVKIENNSFVLPDNISLLYYNQEKLTLTNQKIQQKKFFFVKELIANINKINFKKNSIIKPVYVSNNQILN